MECESEVHFPATNGVESVTFVLPSDKEGGTEEEIKSAVAKVRSEILQPDLLAGGQLGIKQPFTCV